MVNSSRLPTKAKSPPPLVDPMHEVGPGDVLSVFVPFVFDDMKLGKTGSGYSIHVKSDGKISLPLIGHLKAAGKTAIEIEDEIKKKYVDGPKPFLKTDDSDMISVVVRQVYKSNAMSRIEAEKKLLAELTSDFARSETALEAGREACLERIWILEEQGKIAAGSLSDPDNAKLIAHEKRTVEELELQRDQLIILKKLGPEHSEVQAYNLAIKDRNKKIEELKDTPPTPEQIIQRYIVGIKQQIGDLRQVLDANLAIVHENYEKTIAGNPANPELESADWSEKIEDKKRMLSKLTSDLARSETAFESGREACLQHVWRLENSGKITSGSLQVASNSKDIGNKNSRLMELELQRDQLVIIRNYGPNHREIKSLNLTIKKLKTEIDRLIKQEAKIPSVLPEQIIQSYIATIKQQIGDLRQSLDSDLVIDRENYKKTGKPERADPERADPERSNGTSP